MSPVSGSPRGERAGRLTARQLEALRLAANGHTDAQIGRNLGVSPAAANNRLLMAYRRLGVANRTQAVAVAMALELIRADEIRLPDAYGGRT